jgi:glycosyltransferase involved in cell wall biosynthesis
LHKIRFCKLDRKKLPKVLIFGYPCKPAQVGGLLWSKYVSDLIKEKGVFKIANVSSERSVEKKLKAKASCKNILPCLIDDLHDAFTGFTTNPDIAILDSWGEANIILWSLFRIFKPSTKIIVVFHHHEPRISPNILSQIQSKYARRIMLAYGTMVEKMTQAMIKNCDKVLTVSNTSARHLCSMYHMDAHQASKVRIVGAGINKFEIQQLRKDIDFLYVGRIEKLEGIDKIWSLIRLRRPNAKFVMIGRASEQDIKSLKSLGIEHRGVVSEQEKIQIYCRSKVFLFPSIREGFGISLAEAVYTGMTAVAWNLPVFEELYSNNSFVKLVDIGNYEMFAQRATESTNLEVVGSKGQVLSMQKRSAVSSSSTTKLQMKNNQAKMTSWDTVADNVLEVAKELIHSDYDDLADRKQLGE